MCLNHKRGDIVSYNYAKLDGLITEKFKTRRNFCESMKISERSLSLKMSGKTEWKQSQIARACELLGISGTELCNYFFDFKVQNS